MRSEYRWFDFAKEPPGLDRLLAEVRNEPVGSSGSTKSTKQASQKAGRSSSVGGKRCTKGKSCSATCIYAGDDCLMGLEPKVARDIERVLSYIKNYVSQGGQEAAALRAIERIEGSGAMGASAARISKAIDNISAEYTDPNEKEKRINQVFELILPGIAKKGNTGEKQSLDEDQVVFLSRNKAVDEYEKVYQRVKQGELTTPDEINRALAPYAKSRRVNEISNSQVDLAMSLLPQDLMTSLGRQGVPGVWGKWGANQDTLGVPEEGYTLKNQSARERARLIVRIGMQEGMKDMYTGQRVGFGDIDLEHTIPFKVAKEGAETGANFGLTTRKNNREKGDQSPEDWRKSVLSKYPTEGGQLTESSRRKLREEVIAAQKYNDERAQVKGGSRPDTVSAVFRGIEESSNTNTVKQKLKNKALQSMSGYGETYLQGFRANRPGSTRRIYVYRGTAKGEEIMDTAAEVIGRYSREGNTLKVERALEILRSGAPRINEILSQKYGVDRLDSEVGGATSLANGVRDDILRELRGL